MTNNETISQWLGECRHEWKHRGGRPHFRDYKCKLCKEWDNEPLPKAPNYSSDPGAWTPELYQKIEDAGEEFYCTFVSNLAEVLDIDVPASCTEALSRAIKEQEGKK